MYTLFYVTQKQYFGFKATNILPYKGLRPLKSMYSSAPYSRVTHSKTYRGYVKSRIIPNATYNVIFV
jgi:hypothetical protein